MASPRLPELARAHLASGAHQGRDQESAAVRPPPRLPRFRSGLACRSRRWPMGDTPQMTVGTYAHVIRELKGQPEMPAYQRHSSGWIRTTDLTIKKKKKKGGGGGGGGVSREVLGAGWTRPYSRWWTRGGPAWRRAHAGRRTGSSDGDQTPAERGRYKEKTPCRPRRVSTTRGLRRLPQRSSFGLHPRFRRMRDGKAMQQLVEQERAGGRRRPVDGSNRSGLGLGRRTARRGALRARTPTQHRRAAAHATRSGARGAQKLQTAPAGRTPGTQAARRSQARAPPARSDGAARTSAPVDRSGPARRTQRSNGGPASRSVRS